MEELKQQPKQTYYVAQQQSPEKEYKLTRDRLAYSSYTKQLKEEEILIDMGFDVRNIRVYLIFGDNITPMLMETHIAMQMKSCFVF